MSESIGLFYGSSTCYTEMAAEKIRDAIQQKLPSISINVHNIADDCISSLKDYKYLILGIPTWDYGELQEDWENHWQALDNIDLSDKQVALFGLGDQIGYPQWFQDALGPKQFPIERDLIHSCEISQSKPSPTEAECAGTRVTRLVDQLNQFWPIGDVLKCQVLHWGTGDD